MDQLFWLRSTTSKSSAHRVHGERASHAKDQVAAPRSFHGPEQAMEHAAAILATSMLHYYYI